MAVTWTEEQQKVIDTRGCNILVSAAAGSGKTAVLVARILKMITDKERPVDIDRLLVVTFTNAAAAEMRERIRDALEKRAEEEPDNVHLQRQLVLVHNARITTIHSFCLNVLRSHFQTVGIDPSFRIADEGEVLLLEQDAAGETVEAAYENAKEQGDAEYIQFLESFASGKNDRIVEELILQLYHFALGQPWPRRWLEECRAMYGSPGQAESEEPGIRKWGTQENPPWLQFIVEDTGRLLEDIYGQALEALHITEEPDGPYPYAAAIQSDLEKIERLRSCGDYYEYAEAFRNMGTFARLSTKKDDSISPEKKQTVQNIRSEVKDGLGAIQQKYYFDRPETLMEEFAASGIYIRVLTRLTEDFMERLAQMKAEKNVLDFGDLEHLALQVLVEEDAESEAVKTDSRIGNAESEAVKTDDRIECGEPAKKAGRQSGTSGRGYHPTAAAKEYSERFEEIMIDEYQDSNLVQELILNSVAGRGKDEPNRFMVGDVKQSIYRFRLARPELFMEKYRTYRGVGSDACRIDLHRNFRSRAHVLESVNEIFRQIMTENPGGVVYDEDAALYPGAVFEPRPGDAVCGSGPANMSEDGAEAVCSSETDDFLMTELLLLEADTQTKQQEEARLVGRRILQIVGREAVWDKEQGCYRPAQYRDIVILLRTVSGWAETFSEVLCNMGIPCFTGSQKGYFSATEIRVVLSYLQILDNPVQDIPLAAVLHSAIGGFDEEDLARIRIGSECSSFYDCCQEYRKNGADEGLRTRLEAFFSTFEYLRGKCAHTPVHLLLWEILEVTGYGDYASSLPAGAQRKANLDMLVEKAIDYEATSYRGLYHFVRYIENLKKYEVDYGEANTGTESADTVRIMSIHKSKGLEFPIVFVSGMGKQFNETDIRSRIIMHPDYGIGCDYVNLENRTRTATLLKKMIQQKTVSENLGEELRVLYVAMTRAKEKLILTGSVTDAKAKTEKWRSDAAYRKETLSYSCLTGASAYLDWVMPALLRSRAAEDFLRRLELEPVPAADGENVSQFRLHMFTQNETEQEEHRTRTGASVRLQQLLNLSPYECYDEETHEYLDKVFRSVYPYESDSCITGKLSVSELKKLSHIPEDEDMEELYQQETVVPLIPQFRAEQEPLTGAARGTVYHAFMEFLDFSRSDELEMQLEELISCGKMSQEEGEALNLEDIRKFLRSRTGERMACAARAGRLYRERPFVLGVPANEIRSDWNPLETVLVQGIIDAYFQEEDGSIVILDYKTDRVPAPQVLVEKYRAQLDYYGLALKRLTGCEIHALVIYSFYLGREIYL